MLDNVKDRFERRASLLCLLRTYSGFAFCILHGNSCCSDIFADPAHNASNGVSLIPRTFRQTPDIDGYRAEALAMLTCCRGLDSGVQRQAISLLRNSSDNAYDIIDLTGTITKRLHLCGSILHIRLNASHTFNGLLDGFASNLGHLARLMRAYIQGLRAICHLAVHIGYILDLLSSSANLLDLHIRISDQLNHTLERKRCRVFHFMSHHFHTHDQATQFLHHVVEGVGQHAQRVRCHFRLDLQISLTHITDLAHQLFHLSLQYITLGLRILHKIHNIIQHVIHRVGHQRNLVAA